MWGLTYHLERPDSSNPDLELAFYTPDVVKFNAFPPAAASWFPPEQQQLLSHADSVAVGQIVSFDIGPQARESDAADNGFIGFSGAVAPVVIVVEAATPLLAMFIILA